MPSTIRQECKTFVDQYEPVIIALISKQVDPDKICQFIGLCEKPFSSLLESVIPKEEPIRTPTEVVKLLAFECKLFI